MRNGLSLRKMRAILGFGYILIVPLAAGAMVVKGQGGSAGAGVQSAFAAAAVIWVLFALIAFDRLWRGRHRQYRDWINRSMCMMLLWPLERLFILGWVFGFSATGADFALWEGVAAWINLLFVLALGQYVVLRFGLEIGANPVEASTQPLVATGR